MTLIDEQQRALEAGPAPPELGEPPTQYQPCDSCGAPLDDRQRYCVNCGARRAHADDPAARYLSAATRRRRAPTAAQPAAALGKKRGTASLATAAMIAVIPVTLGVGVLIGRSSAGGDGKLIAALHAQKAPVIQYSGGGPAASGAAAAGTAATRGQAVSTNAGPLSSTLTLARGYVVQLGTLPARADQAAATKAEHADQARGATAVGLISQSDYSVTPSPPSGVYVVYSGSFPTQAAAQKALAKLKKKFPAAKVIAVRSSGAAAKSAGKVLTKTHFGSAHQVTGYKPNSSALSQGASVANQDSHDTGKAASGSGLPDVVAVP